MVYLRLENIPRYTISMLFTLIVLLLHIIRYLDSYLL